jgi:hypothetical protein
VQPTQVPVVSQCGALLSVQSLSTTQATHELVATLQ